MDELKRRNVFLKGPQIPVMYAHAKIKFYFLSIICPLVLIESFKSALKGVIRNISVKISTFETKQLI